MKEEKINKKLINVVNLGFNFHIFWTGMYVSEKGPILDMLCCFRD